MDCTTAQEYVSDLADSRELQAGDRRALEAHLEACPRCRAALVAERAVKHALRTRLAARPVPAATALAVTDLIEEQARLDENLAAPRPVRILGMATRRPLLALGLAAATIVAILFAVPPKHGQIAVADASLISEALSSFDLAQSGNASQVPASNPDEVARFFALQNIAFSPTVHTFHGVSIVGARVITHHSARIAEVMYRCGNNTIVVQQVPLSDACASNALALSDSAHKCVCGGGWYWFTDPRRVNVGVWKEGDLVCTTISDCNLTELQALFTGHSDHQ